MISLLGIIALYLVAIGAGKKDRPVTTGTYLFLLLLAIVQTSIILIDMFNRKIPTP